MPRATRALPDPPLRPWDPVGRNRLLPRNMERVTGVTTEMVQTVQSVALSIFTDMSNNNYSLREAIAAVYLSGLQHGSEIERTRHEPG